MQIYNITKERVTELVNKAFDSDDRPADLCLCYQCRLDVTCYVLNRAKPIYVLSERGIGHLKDNYSNNLQDLADLTRLVENGINLVAKAKRAHHLEPYQSNDIKANAYYNFPIITGTVLSGVTFEPLKAEVALYFEEKLVEMKDNKWNNPIQLVEMNNGNYLFWPQNLPAEIEGIEKTFMFQLNISAEGYEEAQHFFEIKLTSESEQNNKFQSHNTFTCNNILLFKN
ncbi:MAG: late competence development ComFB family protein [Spirochaetales bacterium]|nr:late competence development ComFB family protein [Spirochaetales bacterium]